LLSNFSENQYKDLQNFVIKNFKDYSFKYLIDLIISLNFVLEKNQHIKKTIILDEGIISKFSVLNYNNLDFLMDFIKKFYYYKIVNLDIDLNLSYVNALNRKRGLPKRYLNYHKDDILLDFSRIKINRLSIFKELTEHLENIKIVELKKEDLINKIKLKELIKLLC
jgi:hypothetical protein